MAETILYLVDKTYFTRELTVPNISGSDVVSLAEAAALDDAIARWDPVLLTDLLTAEVYADFLEGLNTTPIPEKWSALLAKIVDTTRLVSPVANYVWWEHIRQRVTMLSGVGEVEGRVENATVVTAVNRLILVWNCMCDMLDTLVEWLQEVDQETTYGIVDAGQDWEEFLEKYRKINTFGI